MALRTALSGGAVVAAGALAEDPDAVARPQDPAHKLVLGEAQLLNLLEAGEPLRRPHAQGEEGAAFLIVGLVVLGAGEHLLGALRDLLLARAVHRAQEGLLVRFIQGLKLLSGPLAQDPAQDCGLGDALQALECASALTA